MTSSLDMEQNGWDLNNSYQKKRLVLTENACWNLLKTIDQFKWIVQQWSTATISTSFWGDGRATLEFGNCNQEGRVTVLLDGKEIGNSTLNKRSSSVSFNVAKGSILQVKTDHRAVIRLFDLKLECGEKIIFQN